MRYVFNTLAAAAMFVVSVGCTQGTSTAPGTPKTASGGGDGKTRELKVTSPGGQTVTQDKADEMTVSISRSHFDGPVKIELRNLPTGVTVETKDMTIPAGKTSLPVTIKASPDAKPVEKQPVTVVAKAVEEKDMKDAEVNFDLKVKAKQ